MMRKPIFRYCRSSIQGVLHDFHLETTASCGAFGNEQRLHKSHMDWSLHRSEASMHLTIDLLAISDILDDMIPALQDESAPLCKHMYKAVTHFESEW